MFQLARLAGEAAFRCGSLASWALTRNVLAALVRLVSVMVGLRMLTLMQLNDAVNDDAALRRRRMLQPAGGRGDKIFPPTYPGEGRGKPPPQHVYERRKIQGEDIWCALVDSVQSQANRLEECLLQAIRDGVPIPYVTVNFADTGLHGITEITSLDAPHRIYDAILRDSELNGMPFMDSEPGLRLVKAKPEDATALLEVSPTALLFGAWHSTGQGGGLGAKFARCLVSEITAINVPVDYKDAPRGAPALWGIQADRAYPVEPVTAGRRPGSRIDPLGVLAKAKVFKGPTGWDVEQKRAGKDSKEVKPSEINHGNIRPSIQPLGITCDYAEHSFVLSFAALRRLRFGGADRDRAGRTMLAALGLLAMAEQDARGYALRSRCDLVVDGVASLELVSADGETVPVGIDRAAARTLYEQAFEAACQAGFSLSDQPVCLRPQDKLVEIVRRSQNLALRGMGGEASEEDGNDTGAGN